MAKITIMSGLPASGKSTRAKEIIEQDGNTVRINKDLIRTMLHFDKFNGKNESKTRAAARALALAFLLEGTNVIIDDTNLNPGTLQGWKDLALKVEAKIQYERIDTFVKTCVERDASRDKKVGRSVIVGMALQYGLYPKPDKGIVICDLDGTLCDIQHRLHHVRKPEGERKDWKAFFSEIQNDSVRYDVLAMLAGYVGNGYEIFFVSARPDNYREETEEWLGTMVPYEALFMRRADDKRPDTDVKKDIFDMYFKDPSGIQAVIDDRPSVIRMWRELGLNVVDVGKGEEF